MESETEPMGSGEIAVVTEDWVYDCPHCDDVLSGKAGDTFEVYAYISAKQAEDGFAFYRGTATVDGKTREVLCPANNCGRKDEDGQEN